MLQPSNLLQEFTLRSNEKISRARGQMGHDVYAKGLRVTLSLAADVSPGAVRGDSQGGVGCNGTCLTTFMESE